MLNLFQMINEPLSNVQQMYFKWSINLFQIINNPISNDQHRYCKWSI